MIDKETWKIGTDCDEIGKLIKYHIHLKYNKKHLFEKETLYSSKCKTFHFFFYGW